MTGKVIRIALTRDKGYAFLRGEDGISRFFSAKDVDPPIAFDTIEDGQAVEFTPTVDDRPGDQRRGNAQRAIDVRVVQ